MQASVATKWLVLAAVAVVTLLPGMSAVADSPYGFRPLPVWLAMLYLVGAVFLVAVLSLRLTHSVSAKAFAWRYVASFSVVLATPVITLLATLLPLALLIGAHALLGPSPFLSQWALFNKYVEHFAMEAAHSHVWLLAPAVTLGAWVYAAAHPSERSVAENAL